MGGRRFMRAGVFVALAVVASAWMFVPDAAALHAAGGTCGHRHDDNDAANRSLCNANVEGRSCMAGTSSGTCRQVSSGCQCRVTTSIAPPASCTVNIFTPPSITVEPGATLSGNVVVRCPQAMTSGPAELYLGLVPPTGGLFFFGTNSTSFNGSIQSMPSPLDVIVPGAGGPASTPLPPIRIPAGVALGTYLLYAILFPQGSPLDLALALSVLVQASLILSAPGGPGGGGFIF